MRPVPLCGSVGFSEALSGTYRGPAERRHSSSKVEAEDNGEALRLDTEVAATRPKGGVAGWLWVRAGGRKRIAVSPG